MIEARVYTFTRAYISRGREATQPQGKGRCVRAPAGRERADPAILKPPAMTEPKPSRPSPPRYNHDDVDLQLLGLIRQRDCTYRDLARRTGYGMYVLTHSVARLREAGLVIPGVRSRAGYLVAVRSPK